MTQWISPLEMNMEFSRNIYERKSPNPFLATAQKIATYSLIPLAFIVIFEALVKNLILINLANIGITLLNAIHGKCATSPPPSAAEPPPPPPSPPPAITPRPRRAPRLIREQSTPARVAAVMRSLIRRASHAGPRN